MNRKATLKERANEFRNDFEICSNTLRCKFCNKLFNWEKKSILNKHVKSKGHLSAKFGGVQALLSSASATEIYNRKKLIMETLGMLIECDIPLSKIDKIKPYLVKYAINGGAIPGSTQLRRVYLPKYYEHQFAYIKAKLNSQPICLMTDESPDSTGRYVFHTIARVTATGEEFLIDCSFLTSHTGTDVYTYLTHVLEKYDINILNIDSISTDSASYMKTAVSKLKERNHRILYLRCMCHLMNLVLDELVSYHLFADLRTLFSKFHYLFSISGSRKARYVDFLKRIGTATPKAFPKVVDTRWFTWFNAAYYMRTHLDILTKYTMLEIEEDKEIKTIKEILSVINNTARYKRLKICLEFTKEFSPQIINELKTFESGKITAYEIYKKVISIKSYLEKWKADLAHHCPETVSLIDTSFTELTDKTGVITELTNVVAEMLNGLNKRLNPYESLDFLQCLCIFDPTVMKKGRIDAFSAMMNMPFFDGSDPDIQHEWELFMSDMPDIKNNDLLGYWKSLASYYPNLSKFALRALRIPCTTVAVERSFSIFRSVFRYTRRRFLPENLSQYVVCHYNATKGVSIDFSHVQFEETKGEEEEKEGSSPPQNEEASGSEVSSPGESDSENSDGEEPGETKSDQEESESMQDIQPFPQLSI
eukprot:TRINITY_DN7896_c0_g2_i1.p1 TRINITY_DN7896_c0_g2~~TRINITY_DN7896_c0_g2_i1.p1  ORF type:complete len:706 (-),score=19.97 TRINITY_DN7896_c0_g2_i1:277-2223(-)